MIKLLTKEEKESYENTKIYYTCKEIFDITNMKKKKIAKLEIIAIIQGNIEVLRIAYVI